LDGLVAAAVGTIPGTQDAFASRSEQVGLLFASHAAVAFADADADALDQLALAVTGPDVIGQAKGMLMERCSIDAPRAFALLTRISQQGHRKLRDVAQELVATGRLVGAEEPGPVEGGGR
ncbi:MAG: ANTAR domain-containing protein, partial [Janthinobacterium lividum]